MAVFGPVGDLPLHDAMLLGLHELAIMLMESVYNTPELLR